ncbi:Caleosin-related [Sesbania bispinosa]|nr:Caleosin-related [Sesbania bispinosa]
MASSSPPTSKLQGAGVVAGGIEEKAIPLDENVLQKHAAFFDLNQDGLIYPWETFQVKNIQLAKHGSDTGVYDTQGRIGSLVEWKVLYKLAKDKNGLLQKETIRGVYDGSLFEILKNERSADKRN